MSDVYLKDQSYHNAALVNFQPGQVVVLDLVNSNATNQCVALPAGAAAVPLGVCMETAKLDSTGAVVPGSGVGVRSIGACAVQVASAVAIGDKVAVANTSGQVATQARTAGGTQPVPIVGTARSAASAAGQTVDVWLQIGATW